MSIAEALQAKLLDPSINVRWIKQCLLMYILSYAFVHNGEADIPSFITRWRVDFSQML